MKVDIDEHEELSERNRVQSVPTLLFIRRGKVLSRMVGLKSYEVLSKEARRLLRPSKSG